MTDERARRSVALAATLGGFLASRLRVEKVTAALGCSALAATQILVCREPRWWHWRRDVAIIAGLAEVDAGALGRLLRRSPALYTPLPGHAPGPAAAHAPDRRAGVALIRA